MYTPAQKLLPMNLLLVKLSHHYYLRDSNQPGMGIKIIHESSMVSDKAEGNAKVTYLAWLAGSVRINSV